jgi:peroxiredoxin
MFARKEAVAVPEVGGEAPAFNLPSAQGGQLRLSMRTARGPVVVVFYEGPTEEEVAYFADLASKEDEINMAAGSIVGIGIAEPDEARDFVDKTGLKSYVLYDYARVATREYGLLQKDKKRGEYARPATFVVDGDHKIVRAWVGERPKAEEVLAAVSGITGLPKPAEEAEEQPEEAGGEDAGEKPKKMSAEERERIKAERRAAREAGKSVKSAEDGAEAGSGEKPERKRLSPEEREKRRAERRAARDAGGESAEGEKKPAPKAGKVGVKAEGAAAEETGEKAEAVDPAGAQAGADEETAGKSDAANPTGAQAAAEPAEGDGPEGETSGGGEPGGPDGKAAKGE